MSVATTSKSSYAHPILDDPVRIRRIIANPVYDKLTISRAAQIRQQNPAPRLKRSNAKTFHTPLKSISHEQTTIKPLANTSPLAQHHPPPFRLPTPQSHRSPSRSQVSSSINQRSRRSSSFTNESKTFAEGSIRYIRTAQGLEVQHYLAKNWLTVDVISADACQFDEQTFRDIIEKKTQAERQSNVVFTAEYYRQRWFDLLQSYRQGHLTHEEWAKQNYQLYCLKNFYLNASERELSFNEKNEEEERQKRAQQAFHRWKEIKAEDNGERRSSRLNTANASSSSSSTTSSRSFSSPSIDEHSHSINRLSITSMIEPDFQDLSSYQIFSSKRDSFPMIIDHQRWSLKAMLKRVVGLADPLPSTDIKRKDLSRSSMTNVSSDSGFESNS